MASWLVATAVTTSCLPMVVKSTVMLAARGMKHLYVDGGITIQRFLNAGLIDHATLTRVPVIIGDGIPLFGSTGRDIRLRHVETRTYLSGLVTTEYDVVHE